MAWVRQLHHYFTEPTPFTVIGRIVIPRDDITEAIECYVRRELRTIVGHTAGRIEVWRPGTHGSQVWHRDCGGAPHYLIVWASYSPTEVRWNPSSEWREWGHTAYPYDVIKIDNRKAEHRAPLLLPFELRKRWFARVVVS